MQGTDRFEGRSGGEVVCTRPQTVLGVLSWMWPQG